MVLGSGDEGVDAAMADEDAAFHVSRPAYDQMNASRTHIQINFNDSSLYSYSYPYSLSHSYYYSTFDTIFRRLQVRSSSLSLIIRFVFRSSFSVLKRRFSMLCLLRLRSW